MHADHHFWSQSLNIYEAIVGGAMTIADYSAMGVLFALILWVVARVYLQSRRF